MPEFPKTRSIAQLRGFEQVNGCTLHNHEQWSKKVGYTTTHLLIESDSGFTVECKRVFLGEVIDHWSWCPVHRCFESVSDAIRIVIE